MITVPIPFTRNLWLPSVVRGESSIRESLNNTTIKFAIHHLTLLRQQRNFKPDKTDPVYQETPMFQQLYHVYIIIVANAKDHRNSNLNSDYFSYKSKS